MSGTTAPPLLLIQSAIGRSDWVLTVVGDAAPYSLRLAHNAASERQLWLREEDPARGGFFLRNPFLDLCLRAGDSQGGHVGMAAKTMGDPELIWRKENGDDWGALNKLTDWEQKLNVAGDGPYDQNTPIIQYEWDGGSDHEYWKLVPYDPSFGTASVDYPMAQQTLTIGHPVTAAVTSLDNRSSTASLQSTVTLKSVRQKTFSHSVSEQTQKTLTVTQKFGAKFAVDKTFSVNEEGSVSVARTTARTTIDQATTSESIEVTASATVTVAPGRNYQIALMARECMLTIPYVATLTRRTVEGSPGASYTINGTYRFEDAYRFDIVVTDVGAATTVPNAAAAITIDRRVVGQS